MTKKQVIERIFDLCQQNGNLVFDNDVVKKVLRDAGSSTNNPYDITKVDDLSKLPEKLVDKGYTVIHLGDGRHKFIKCLEKIYHTFERIGEADVIGWPYRPSLLNDFSISESSILSLANNHRVLHDFLYQDISASPKMYNSERKNSIAFDYYINDEKISVSDLQIEIDLTVEYNGEVTVFEGKNTPPTRWLDNFNLYQLYNPFRFYYDLQQENKLAIKKLSTCYLVKQKDGESTRVRLYKYTFENPLDIASVKLLKKREYRLKKRALEDE
ncbi:MAG: hypothetical protein LBC53_01440 [Spirochaetaceae bacterium]|nr:hypothetical protein [Spirochaetaceae bacterium]